MSTYLGISQSLARARENGLSAMGKARRSKDEYLAAIVEALKGGPLSMSELCARARMTHGSTQHQVKAGVALGLLVDFGSVRYHGTHAKVIGLPGQSPPVSVRGERYGQRHKAGSGVIAPSPYCRGYNWRAAFE